MYLLAILIPSAEFDAFIAEMESSPTSPLSVGRPALVWVLIGYSVFQILLQLPPLIAPAMGLEGYFGESYDGTRLGQGASHAQRHRSP